MFKLSGRSAAVLMLIVSVGLLSGSQALAAGKIEVTGEAEIKVAADHAIMTLGVETLDQDLSKSLNENNVRANRMLDVLTSHGLDARKIQTGYMQCYPKYERSESRSTRLMGYTVSRSIVVTLNDLSKLEGVLSKVIESGATQLHGIQFRTSQLRRHRDAARDAAMKHAKEKAEAMAAAVGQKIGGATAVKEVEWDRGRHQIHAPYPQMQQQSQISYEREPSMGESIAPGEIGISAKVIVTFDLQ